MNRLRDIVVGVVAVLLTLQGTNAVAMPLCDHDSAGSAIHDHVEPNGAMNHAHHDHGSGHTDSVLSGQDGHSHHSHGDSALACDDCELCALTGASTLPSGELTAAITHGFVKFSSIDIPLVGVTPRRLSKPPLLV